MSNSKRFVFSLTFCGLLLGLCVRVFINLEHFLTVFAIFGISFFAIAFILRMLTQCININWLLVNVEALVVYHSFFVLVGYTLVVLLYGTTLFAGVAIVLAILACIELFGKQVLK